MMKKMLFAIVFLATAAVSAAWTPVEIGFSGPMSLPWCERVYGFKGAVVGHSATSVYGVDLSGLGRSRDVRGLGLDVFASIDDEIRGVVFASFCAWNDDVSGVQFSGLVSKAKELNGVQCAGFFTWTNRGQGVQVGCFNVADEFRGLQLGVMNSTMRLEGIQVGLLNFHRVSPLHSILPVVNVGW